MVADNTFSIRFATGDDAGTVRRLAERNSQPPLTERVLIAETRAGNVAATSLDDGRAVSTRVSEAGDRSRSCARLTEGRGRQQSSNSREIDIRRDLGRLDERTVLEREEPELGAVLGGDHAGR
jgi:hypothetical protein